MRGDALNLVVEDPIKGIKGNVLFSKITSDEKYITFQDKNKIFKALMEYQAIILVSGTGTGKTVIFPKLLSHFFNYRKPIIITIPTKKAVGSCAEYAAKCMDVEYKYDVVVGNSAAQVSTLL